MNYYEHHIGDYDQATAHLTACEDGIYSRLIRRYYATEKPLPADVGAVQRLVRARTKEEKQAVSDMLNEFFTLQADGWHQQRCDEVIAQYREGEPEREARKANEENRLKRHREERAALFKKLTDAGQHAPWNISMKDLRELATRVETATETPPATAPATAPETPATATQYPIPNTHPPLTNTLPSGEGTHAKVNGKKRETPIPKDFAVSDRVKAWAAKEGFRRLEEHLAAFRLKCEAKGYTYLNWDSAFMGAIREDWAKLNGPTTPDYSNLNVTDGV